MHKECDIHPLYLKAASTVPAEEYFTSKSITTKVLERREVLVGEMISREPQVLVGEMISTEPQVLVGEMISREPQVFGDREDVWFILLDVIPRGTPFVPPGISKRTSPALCIPCGYIHTLTCGVAGIVFAVATSVARVQKAVVQSCPAETAGPTVEDQREVVVEETRLQREDTAGSQTVPQPGSVSRRVEDDWFVLFNVVPRTPTYVSPGTARIAGCASHHR